MGGHFEDPLKDVICRIPPCFPLRGKTSTTYFLQLFTLLIELLAKQYVLVSFFFHKAKVWRHSFGCKRWNINMYTPFFPISKQFLYYSAGRIMQRHITTPLVYKRAAQGWPGKGTLGEFKFVTRKISIMKQVVGLQKQRLWSHFATDFDKIGVYGKLTTWHIGLYMNCKLFSTAQLSFNKTLLTLFCTPLSCKCASNMYLIYFIINWKKVKYKDFDLVNGYKCKEQLL